MFHTAAREDLRERESRSMPACASVRFHKASTSCVMMPSTLNSLTARTMGLGMYTITTLISSRKIFVEARNASFR